GVGEEMGVGVVELGDGDGGGWYRRAGEGCGLCAVLLGAPWSGRGGATRAFARPFAVRRTAARA
ncbi:hypothetical protein DWU95_27095, partial [Burkholderia contaminans]